eukprot:TRINITY_DN1149_c0_g1_i1.p2 TRINITY_DN1149_c0_g1~~TRINITY_DN1149_c0_g1_i1.p2  ORF type:complete len:150 (-),score=3.38 TRINITY_DN1149_c0_g1_i1:462-911(-)
MNAVIVVGTMPQDRRKSGFDKVRPYSSSVQIARYPYVIVKLASDRSIRKFENVLIEIGNPVGNSQETIDQPFARSLPCLRQKPYGPPWPELASEGHGISRPSVNHLNESKHHINLVVTIIIHRNYDGIRILLKQKSTQKLRCWPIVDWV